MKILAYLSFLILPIMAINHSPEEQKGTTIEEYQYMTRGFYYQMTMGLDPVKKGITFKEVKLYEGDNRTLVSIVFYRDGLEEPIGTVMPQLGMRDSEGQRMLFCSPSLLCEESVRKALMRDISNNKKNSNGDLLGMLVEQTQALHRYHLGIEPEASKRTEKLNELEAKKKELRDILGGGNGFDASASSVGDFEIKDSTYFLGVWLDENSKIIISNARYAIIFDDGKEISGAWNYGNGLLNFEMNGKFHPYKIISASENKFSYYSLEGKKELFNAVRR